MITGVLEERRCWRLVMLESGCKCLEWLWWECWVSGSGAANTGSVSPLALSPENSENRRLPPSLSLIPASFYTCWWSECNLARSTTARAPPSHHQCQTSDSWFNFLVIIWSKCGWWKTIIRDDFWRLRGHRSSVLSVIWLVLRCGNVTNQLQLNNLNYTHAINSSKMPFSHHHQEKIGLINFQLYQHKSRAMSELGINKNMIISCFPGLILGFSLGNFQQRASIIIRREAQQLHLSHSTLLLKLPRK